MDRDPSQGADRERNFTTVCEDRDIDAGVLVFHRIGILSRRVVILMPLVLHAYQCTADLAEVAAFVEKELSTFRSANITTLILRNRSRSARSLRIAYSSTILLLEYRSYSSVNRLMRTNLCCHHSWLRSNERLAQQTGQETPNRSLPHAQRNGRFDIVCPQGSNQQWPFN